MNFEVVNKDHILIDPIDQLYVIEWMLEEEREIAIGKLGCFTFPKGIYVYIGSAKKNVEARVKRHLMLEKKKRWHMDYLRPFVIARKAVTLPNYLGECSLKEFIQTEYIGSIIIKGFGSSDCRCDSHLLKLQVPIDDLSLLKKKWMD